MAFIPSRILPKTPIEHMERIAGKWGEALWHKAHGRGSAEITTDWEQKSMSHEKHFDCALCRSGFPA
ncbi:MAG: hypothetical protein IPP99_05700 [Chitinophagaceae bacterium]|nr:hypothetical protein [Chitinophagaceae bacterium]